MQSKQILSTLALVLTASNAASGETTVHDHSTHHTHQHAISTIGTSSVASKATKIYHVDLSDAMKMTFDHAIEIKSGEIVRFIITNHGHIDHEFSIGSEKEHEAHRDMMKQMPDMVHNDGASVTVKPNETKELTWKFGKKGEAMFACNIPGHFEAGMKESFVIR